VLNRPFLLTLPAPVLRILFGEFADEGLLASARVIPHRLTDAGFQFDHPELAEAFRFLLGYRVKAS
jgi:NAD dependent epimerase/dehydratase family enzyme